MQDEVLYSRLYMAGHVTSDIAAGLLLAHPHQSEDAVRCVSPPTFPCCSASSVSNTSAAAGTWLQGNGVSSHA
ncbi:hypothetical protein WN71_000715 [Streptomyces mangrovisoli]|uniref:Uncharacterized protein n=1 Tax=Streptomyces mangrovisoli TaxID=1428628 RepID=A0A1J4P695_9ACTN|nr:hypothetical protein WN71_000715 [Streptomyces mangrovisoli]